MSGTRDENVFMARLAEQAERYEDMMEYMKRVALIGTEMSLDERNLLSVAYKNSVGARRSACRQIAAEQAAGRDEVYTQLAANYRTVVEGELDRMCGEILDIVSRVLIPAHSDGESKVFFLKMKADYYRYLAELHTGDKRATNAGQASEAYQAATEMSSTELDPANPIALGLALNFSVFHNEVYGKTREACELAQSALQRADQNLHSLPAEYKADSVGIMQLMAQNLELWQATLQQSGGPANDMMVSDM